MSKRDKARAIEEYQRELLEATVDPKKSEASDVEAVDPRVEQLPPRVQGPKAHINHSIQSKMNVALGMPIDEALLPPEPYERRKDYKRPYNVDPKLWGPL